MDDRFARVIYTRTKSRAKQKGYLFDLTFEQAKNLLDNDCFYCGQTPTGFDRLNPRVGYTIPNVIACCRSCNSVKGRLHYSTWAVFLNKFLPFEKQLPESYSEAQRLSEELSQKTKEK